MKNKNGFTLVEVMVVLVLLTLSFMVFLRALNTGKTIRTRSEIRTTQSVILNSLENEIRSRRFDENTSYPWSFVLGKDPGESISSQFDDIEAINKQIEDEERSGENDMPDPDDPRFG